MAAQRRLQATGPTLKTMHVIADGLLERPDPALDEALNAAAACFIRHGLAHTSVRDIADQLGVSKATVYRQVGSLDDVLRTLLARETHRLVDTAVRAVGDTAGPGAVLALVTAAGQHICTHPLVRKVLTDEPALAAELFAYLPAVSTPITAVLTSVIDDLRPDASGGSPSKVVAEVAVRIVLAAIVLPPDDLPTLLHEAIGPHLGI